MDALPATVPPGWGRAGEIDGVPLWRWRNEPFHVATRDMDQLLFIGAALTRFDHMGAEEFREYVAPLIRRADGRSGRGW